MDVAVITICSRRKRLETEAKLSGQRFTSRTLASVAEKWGRACKTATTKVPAENLYSGRGFGEVKKAATAVGADLWVISAGYGLIHKSHLVAAYDLTISPNSPQSLDRLVGDHNVSLSEWWTYINKGKRTRAIAQLVSRSPKTLFVIGLTRPYFRMIEKDLETLSADSLNRVRLIGVSHDAIENRGLGKVLLPYDERLESLGPPFAGTRSDFPQRATRHFLERVWQSGSGNSLRTHKSRVAVALSGLAKPKKITRRKMGDQELLGLITKHWQDIEGQSGKGLRFFRDHLGVACEQGRFKTLFHEAKQKQSAI